MVTVYKNIRDISNPFYMDILEVLDNIRKGKSEFLISEIRKETDKFKRNELKQGLTSILFSGEFKGRTDASIIAHSGYICLDFDGFDSIDTLLAKKKKLAEDDYTFSCFISPSGDGLKVIVKIPKEITNHKKYFNSLEKYYDCKEFDTTSKNISRVCYESYDPEIYINEFSYKWNTLEEEKEIKQKTKTFVINDSNEIVRRLMIWWNKNYGIVSGARSNNVFILASAFNEYGLSKGESLDICSQFSDSDFPESEIKTIVNSAYKNEQNHNVKFYEDERKIEEIKTLKLSGVTNQDIAEKEGVSEVLINDIEINEEFFEFWEENPKSKKVKVVPHRFKLFLEKHGFWKYYIGSEGFSFVRVENNLVSTVTEDNIKTFILDYILDHNLYHVYDDFALNLKIYMKQFLSLLGTINLLMIKDTSKYAWLFYKNTALKVKSDSITMVSYNDIDGYIWKDRILDREYKEVDYHNCIFEQFVQTVGGDNYKAVENAAGFLLHSYKIPKYCPAIIINDEVISDNPNGGTGKGIFATAISYIKRSVLLDGKVFSFDGSFIYQSVNPDTQILVFDDIRKNFAFERLFSVITNGITIEKKGRDSIIIPFEYSPKIIITTNYAVKGSGNSFERRKYELEFVQKYSKTFTPYDHFGHTLFDDWDKDEWLRFDNYMIGCIQGFLNDGFISQEHNSLEARKFISETCYDFYEWAMDSSELFAGFKHNMANLFQSFIAEYPDYSSRGKYKIANAQFYKWLKSYNIFKSGKDAQSGRGSDGKWIIFDSIESPTGNVEINFNKEDEAPF